MYCVDRRITLELPFENVYKDVVCRM